MCKYIDNIIVNVMKNVLWAFLTLQNYSLRGVQIFIEMLTKFVVQPGMLATFYLDCKICSKRDFFLFRLKLVALAHQHLPYNLV